MLAAQQLLTLNRDTGVLEFSMDINFKAARLD